jgi:hypothetical protein
MEKLALEKAQARLSTAERALAANKAARTFPAFEEAWTTFLLATNTIYTVLEQGAKSHATSRQWFAGEQKRRRKDPLLQYLHQARNADEHGIEPITKRVPMSLELSSQDGQPFSIYGIKIMKSGKVEVDAVSDAGGFVEHKLHPPYACLRTVYDRRHGNKYDPPNEHFGTRLDDLTPFRAAQLSFAACRDLISRAEALLT